MRNFWIRIVLWWNDVCPKHGIAKEFGKSSYFCPKCRGVARLKRQGYLDELLKELNP